MSKKILVTGVGGNVGQYIAAFFHEKGYKVVGIYRNHKPEFAKYELIQCDMAYDKIACKNVDIVLHIAASLKGNVRKMIDDNIQATNNLIDYAEKYKVKRFYYFSTVSVYGNVLGELKTDTCINNPDIYGITKLLCENLVRESRILYKVIIQLPRMLGPFVDLNDTEGSGFLTMTKKILSNADLVCYIPSAKYNNYMHVSDLADFVLRLIGKEQEGCKTYLLAAKDKLKMLEILEIMKNVSGSTSKIIVEDKGIETKCALISISEAIKGGYSPTDSKSTISRFIREMMYE